MQFLRSAVPHSEQDALDVRLLHAARAIWWVYVLLTGACALLLWIVGVPGFDALAYAMGAMSRQLLEPGMGVLNICSSLHAAQRKPLSGRLRMAVVRRAIISLV